MPLKKKVIITRVIIMNNNNYTPVIIIIIISGLINAIIDNFRKIDFTKINLAN